MSYYLQLNPVCSALIWSSVAHVFLKVQLGRLKEPRSFSTSMDSTESKYYSASSDFGQFTFLFDRKRAEKVCEEPGRARFRCLKLAYYGVPQALWSSYHSHISRPLRTFSLVVHFCWALCAVSCSELLTNAVSLCWYDILHCRGKIISPQLWLLQFHHSQALWLASSACLVKQS